MSNSNALRLDLMREMSPESIPKKSQVDCWLIDLAHSGDSLEVFSETLSNDERQRAGKFRVSQSRAEFIVRRAALREILSLYLGVEAAEIRFDYNRFGKPFLAGQNNCGNLYFSLARTRGTAVCAVTAGREIGADVEVFDGLANNAAVFERFFSPREKMKLRSLKGNEQTTAFYRCWTRKEAVLKALGEGLSHRLETFSVSTGAEFVSRVSFAAQTAEKRQFQTFTFVFDSKYITSIAFKNPVVPQLRLFDWSPNIKLQTPMAARRGGFGDWLANDASA